MIYLSGSIVPGLHEYGVGYMATPAMGWGRGQEIPPGATWAADNGCFSQPERFSWDWYLDWLARQPRETCLFATSPDVMGDAWATLERYGPGHELIRMAGYRAALVAQDGLVPRMVPWRIVDALFIGGTTEWKLSERAFELVGEAKRRGKWVHAGRVNSYRRLRAFAHAGADSADGTFLKYGPDKNLPRMLRWLDQLHAAPSLLEAT